MKKIFMFTITYILITALLKASIIVAPEFVIFDEDSKSIQNITVIYKGNEKLSYKLSLVHMIQLPDGQLVKTETPIKNELFADELIRFSPRTFTLYPPEESSSDENKSSSQIIRIRKNFPSNLPNGEYKSHLLITPIAESLEKKEENLNSTGMSINVKLLVGLSIPIIVRKGKLDMKAYLKNIKIDKTDPSKPLINFDIYREGNKSLRGVLNIKLNNEIIAKINNLSVYLSTDKRSLSLPLLKNNETNKNFSYKELEGKTLTIEYIELSKNTNNMLINEKYTVKG